MDAGSRIDLMIVASTRTATASQPHLFQLDLPPQSKAPKTPTMIAAALVICPAVTLMPWETTPRCSAPVVELLDPVEHQHMGVHR